MLDEANVDQQEALGIIGVNLLFGAFYHEQSEKLIGRSTKTWRRTNADRSDQVFRTGYANVDTG